MVGMNSWLCGGGLKDHNISLNGNVDMGIGTYDLDLGLTMHCMHCITLCVNLSSINFLRLPISLLGIINVVLHSNR